MIRTLFTLGGFGVIMGGIFLFLGFKERSIAAVASKEPEVVPLKTVIARGPEGNPNIILTDFVLCDNFVFKTENGRWTNVWVPVVPSDSLLPGQRHGGNPAVVQAIIFTINARNEADLFSRCEQPRLRALITNKIVNLGSKEQELLRQSYPGTDFTKCVIIQEGREPAGGAKLLLMIGGGSLSAVLGLGFLAGGYYFWRKEQTTPVRKRRKRPVDDDDEDDEPRSAKRRPVRDDYEDEEKPRKPPKRRPEPVDDDEPPRKVKRRPRDDD